MSRDRVRTEVGRPSIDVQSLRVTLRVKGAEKARSSFLAFLRSIAYRT
jgi:hypothetical protein